MINDNWRKIDGEEIEQTGIDRQKVSVYIGGRLEPGGSSDLHL
ncbi:MAG: hypothetical protein ACYTEQ_15850 [Planctomycetota bacterium]|jgi:hypothetical protein